MPTLQADEVLGQLHGSHDVLSLLASDLRRGDVLIKGACLRVLVAPVRRLDGYLTYEVARSLDTPVLGRWVFLDDGVARFTVLRAA